MRRFKLSQDQPHAVFKGSSLFRQYFESKLLKSRRNSIAEQRLDHQNPVKEDIREDVHCLMY